MALQEINQSVNHSSRPNVFTYFDHRQFIKDFMDFMIQFQGLSKRRISMACGFRSPSYLPMLIAGQRDLGAAGIRAIAKGFGLTKDEAAYFELLVDHQISPSENDRTEAFARMVKLRARQGLEELMPQQLDAFVHWQCVLVFEALATQWAKLSTEEQAKSLGLSLERLEQIYKSLENLNLIENDNGQWVRKAAKIQTTRDVHTQFMRQYHLDILKQAGEAIKNESKDERFVQNVTFSLSEENYQRLTKLVDEFTSEVSVGFPGESQAAGVYQLSIQLFSLLKLRS